MNSNPNDVAPWLAVIMSSGTIFGAVYSYFKRKKTEYDEVEKALDKQPYIKKALETDSIKDATEYLTSIAQTQSEYISRLHKRHKEEIKEFEKEVYKLKQQNVILTIKVQKYEANSV